MVRNGGRKPPRGARLPESSGGVTAFKFRDPDGHPLELLAFPDGKVPSRWGAQPDAELCGNNVRNRSRRLLPTNQQAKADGIDIVPTEFRHTWMSDRGPEPVKQRIQATLDEFLSKGNASHLAPANTDNLAINNAGAPLP